MEAMVNLWGAAGILLVLTILYCGIAIWAARKDDWGEANGAIAWLSFACWGLSLIGLWAAWINQLFISI